MIPMKEVTFMEMKKIGITEDGVIDESERDDMGKVLHNLEELEQITQSMKLWVEKNLS